MCGAWCSRSSWGPWLRRRSAILSLSLLFALSTTPMLAGQSNSPSSPTHTALTRSELVQMATQLVERLQARIAESEILSGQALKLQAEAESLRQDLAETSISLEKLQTDYAALESSFAAYEAKARLNLESVTRERDAALVIARLNGLYLKIGLGVVAVETGYIAGHLWGWW